ncbi:S-norcoclaurine synthase-like [Durio zibethinus]|uniref:S-norcoclaurine synthase-like n=1 Tax=Durio zibethinus TaxID=66656 RepID=A0A6P5ZLF5_DURZI|nr:S-norcoclaurine synthase-like [Durio zibethinus]
MGVHSQELKHLTNELEVKVPASEVWELYRHLGISRLAAKQLKNVIQNIEVLKGDGGIGTVLRLTFVPGNSSYTEKFTVIDDKKRVKVAQGLKGGCLAIGCSVQIVRFDIIQKSMTSSIIKSDISYAVKKEFEAKDPKPNIQLLAAAAQVAKKFLESKHDA